MPTSSMWIDRGVLSIYGHDLHDKMVLCPLRIRIIFYWRCSCRRCRPWPRTAGCVGSWRWWAGSRSWMRWAGAQGSNSQIQDQGQSYPKQQIWRHLVITSIEKVPRCNNFRIWFDLRPPLRVSESGQNGKNCHNICEKIYGKKSSHRF